MEVESKFNPDDWNGYLHTYETIEEYNAAKKLLPHTARIESTKEAKYISRTQAELPELYMIVDKLGGSMVNSTGAYHDVEEYKYFYRHHRFDGYLSGYKTYKLLGEINQLNKKWYLWELYDADSQDEGAVDTDPNVYRYVIANTITIGVYIIDNDDPTRFKNCFPISINNDEFDYDGSASIQTAEVLGNPVRNIIYEIYAPD